jgi:tetratricopeptide (TPR) repeat protein
MWGKSMAVAPTWTAAAANRQHLHSANHKMGTGPTVTVLLILLLSVTTALAASGSDPSRKHVLKIVTQIQRADYEGDRAALKRLYGELTPFLQSKELGSRIRYWRGFALWRRALNGFNESVEPKELEEDLNQAVNEFHEALAKDPEFVDAKIGAGSCLSNLIFLNQKDAVVVQKLIAQAGQMLKEAQTSAPDNPRLSWVLGPNRWYAPAERGGGQSVAMEIYERGLAEARKHKSTATDPLEPSWGEPELLMNLAWSNLHRTTPDLNAAEQCARSALELVPYWHYVKDILMPQIRAAQAKVAKGQG